MAKCLLCLAPTNPERPRAAICDECRAKREVTCARTHEEYMRAGNPRSCYFPHAYSERLCARAGHCCYCGAVHEQAAIEAVSA